MEHIVKDKIKIITIYNKEMKEEECLAPLTIFISEQKGSEKSEKVKTEKMIK